MKKFGLGECPELLHTDIKSLTCSKCGAGDGLFEQNGHYVCAYCGAKYAMNPTKITFNGDLNIKDSTVVVAGRNHNRDYRTLAINTYDGKNYRRAEEYCLRILENDKKNYEAWYLMGCSIAETSTLTKIRLEETASCFCKVILYNESSSKSVCEDFREYALKCEKKACDVYAENPTSVNGNAMIYAADTILKAVSIMQKACDISSYKMKVDLYWMIYMVMNIVYPSKITGAYGAEQYPNKSLWDNYTSAATKAADIYVYIASKLYPINDESIVLCYERAIDLWKGLINSHSYKRSRGSYVTGYQFTENAKRDFKNKIKHYESEIRLISPQKGRHRLRIARLNIVKTILIFALVLCVPVGLIINTEVSTAEKRDEQKEKIEIIQAEKRQERYEETHPDSYVVEDPEIPYVGMPESMINDTGLGKYHYSTSYHNNGLNVDTYTWYVNKNAKKKQVIFSVETEYDVVSEVNDYRENPIG